MPKLASQQKMNSILRAANHAISASSRARSNWNTLACVAEPQSQKVHWNGQPRLVSHSTIQFSSVLACISGANVPSR
jgi:hypothetical protein